MPTFTAPYGFNTVAAIKLYRQLYPTSLKDAKLIIEAADYHRKEPPFPY